MNRLLKITIIAVLIPISIYLWPSAFGGDTDFLIVSGQSMYPTILDGSFVITKQSPPYEVDDIVAYYSKESRVNVVHRIIESHDNGAFIIKGDNNPNPDAGAYTYNDIFGEVVFATPFVGQGLEMLRNPIMLLISAVVLIAIQSEQKRRRKKKEKIRRILLGIPKPNQDETKNTSNKNQKPNNSVFLMAMMLNVMTYVLLQISISSQIDPKGDQVTGFLFNIFEPSFASTLSFGIYSIFILSLYYMAKKSYSKAKYETHVNKRTKQSLELLLGKNFKPIPALTQFLTFMYLIMAVFHLMAIGSQIGPLLVS